MLLSLLIIILTVTSHWYNQQLLLSIFPAIIRLNKQHYLSTLLKDSQIVEAKCCFFGQQAAGVQKGWMQWCHYPLGVKSRDISKERDSMITTMHKETRKLVSMSTACMCVCVFVCRSIDYLWKISERSFLCDQVETLYYPPISSLNNLLAYSTMVIDLRTPKTIYMHPLW